MSKKFVTQNYDAKKLVAVIWAEDRYQDRAPCPGSLHLRPTARTQSRSVRRKYLFGAQYFPHRFRYSRLHHEPRVIEHIGHTSCSLPFDTMFHLPSEAGISCGRFQGHREKQSSTASPGVRLWGLPDV